MHPLAHTYVNTADVVSSLCDHTRTDIKHSLIAAQQAADADGHLYGKAKRRLMEVPHPSPCFPPPPPSPSPLHRRVQLPLSGGQGV
jgi:hypothetical protein